LETELTPELTKIKEIAIVGMQTNFQKTAEQSISILLNFSVSEVTPYSCLTLPIE
jgi:predicted CoA-binding protein